MHANLLDTTSVPRRHTRARASGGWRQLFGNFPEPGLAIVARESDGAAEVDWARTFHPGSLAICLNVSGNGWIEDSRERVDVDARTVAVYAQRDTELKAVRLAGTPHKFVTIEMSRRWLETQLSGSMNCLQPAVREFIEGDGGRNSIAVVRAMTIGDLNLAASLTSPPVAETARGLWYQSKVLEIAAAQLFNMAVCEPALLRQQSLARERVEKAKWVLQRDLENPPTLEMLGREVGCSACYLSRIFSAQTNLTISQYVRQLRIERAASLLRSGRCNVTETAMAVGYSSLSHFSKAFCEVMGCNPCCYAHGRLVPEGAQATAKKWQTGVSNISAQPAILAL